MGRGGKSRRNEKHHQRLLYIIGTVEDKRSGDGRQRGGQNGGQIAENDALATDEQNQQGGGCQRDGADGRLRAVRDVMRSR